MMSAPQQQLLQSLDHVSFSNQVSGEPLDLRIKFASSTATGRRGSYSYGVESPTAPRVETINALTRIMRSTSAQLAVENKVAPMPITVTIEPPVSTDQADTAKAATLHKHLVSASSIAHLYTGILLVNQILQNSGPGGGGGDLWDPTEPDEAIVALSNTASAAYRAMMGPLVGLYSIRSTTASTYSKTMKRRDIHARFVDEFMGEYGLSSTQLDALDGVLTEYVKTVRGIPVTPEEQSTVDQVFRVNRVAQVNVSGDSRCPVWVLRPQTRLVHLKVNIDTWMHAVRRAKIISRDGLDEAIKIAMDITIVDAELNVDEFLRHKDKFGAIVQTLAGQDLYGLGMAISTAGVTDDI